MLGLYIRVVSVSLNFRLAPCYETATTRAFYRGRTETMRPCTTELSQWIHAMLDGKTKVDSRNISNFKALLVN